MKKLFLTIQICTIITFNTINAAHLAVNSRTNARPQLTLDDQLLHFDQKMRIDYPTYTEREWWLNKENKFLALSYIRKIQRMLPEVVENTKIYALDTDSLFGQSLHNLINTVGKDYYATITTDILHNRKTDVHNRALKRYLFNQTIEKHIKKNALYNISALCAIQLAHDTESFDLSHSGNLAAVATKSGEFIIYDLKQYELLKILPKRAVQGGIYFSNNDSYCVTVTAAQEQPVKVDIDIWNIDTSTILHSLQCNQLIQKIRLLLVECSSKKQVFKLLLLDDQSILFSYFSDSEKITWRPMKEEDDYYSFTKKKMWLPCTSPKRYNIFYTFCNHTKTLTKRCTFLGICMQALSEATNRNNLENIQKASIYPSLTPFEKNIFDDLLDKKDGLLDKKIKQLTTSSLFSEQNPYTFSSQ